jgi:hypothetical protein
MNDAATRRPVSANAHTFHARTELGRWTCDMTGSELWDDEGVTRQTLVFLVTEPNGNTYGFFARDLDQGREIFFNSVY